MGVFSNKRNVFVLIFFVAALLYVMYLFIFTNDGNNNDNVIKGYTNEQVEIYTVKNNLVKDYNKFYTLEDISNQIINALKEENYSGVYAIISSDFAGGISKEQWMELLKNYYIENFSSVVDENGEEEVYRNSNNLVNAYSIDSDNYILEIKNNHDSTTKLGVKLINNINYKIVYLEFKR